MDIPKVVNLRKASLNKSGYDNIREWLNHPNHVYIGRFMRIFINTGKIAKEATGSKIVKGKVVISDSDFKGKSDDSLEGYPDGSYVTKKGTIMERFVIPQSIWHNPHKSKNPTGDFKTYITTKNQELLKRLPELKGKTIGCWCKPKPCHGDIIVSLYTEHVK